MDETRNGGEPAGLLVSIIFGAAQSFRNHHAINFRCLN